MMTIEIIFHFFQFPGLTAVLHSVLLILLLSVPCPTSVHIYNFSYLASFLTMWTLRISVFYNLVLFVTRTINIVSPFYHVNKTVLLVFLGLVPWFPWFPVIVHQMTVKYDEDYMGFKLKILSSSSLVGEDLVHMIFGASHYPPVIICLVIPFLVPTVIAVVSLLIQLKCLLSDSSVHAASTTEQDPLKKRAALTVFLLTLVFTICNTASVTYWMRVCLDIEDDYLGPGNAIWVYITGVTLPFMNSAVAPTILICRSKTLRKEIWNIIFRSKQDSKTVSKSTVVSTTLAKDI